MNDLPASREHRAQAGKAPAVDVGLHDGTNAGKTFRTASNGLQGLVTTSHCSPHFGENLRVLVSTGTGTKARDGVIASWMLTARTGVDELSADWLHVFKVLVLRM